MLLNVLPMTNHLQCLHNEGIGLIEMLVCIVMLSPAGLAQIQKGFLFGHIHICHPGVDNNYKFKEAIPLGT